MVTWDDLTFNTRCIYQAFTKLAWLARLEKTGEDLANYVNETYHLDADDTRAVSRLADYCKLRLVGGCTGDFFTREMSFTRDTELVVLITTEANMPAPVRTMAKSCFEIASLNAERLLWNQAFDGIRWHAVYGRANGRGVVQWTDDQGLYPNGPTGAATYALVFETH